MAASLQNNDHQKQADQVAVVMVPFPAHGHLNQLLQLSRLVLSYNLAVHYVGTAAHNRQTKLRVHGWNPAAAKNIHFHDFSVPPFASPDPEPTAHPNQFLSHLQPLFDAAHHLRQPIGALLRRLSSASRRVVVVYDSLMAAVIQDIGSIPNGEAYNFHSVSAFAVGMFLGEAMGKPADEIFTDGISEELPSLKGCFSDEIMDFIASQYAVNLFYAGNIYNTSRVIESTYMDLLEKIEPTNKHWALGPFNPLTNISEKTSNRHWCLDWLDKQPSRSVLYVSFGTTTTMPADQIKELAYGLQKSNQKFIWVLRDADKGDVFKPGESETPRKKSELLPKGFEEKINEIGLVVRDWAPQLEILGHRATGGFMSHCGWNSCMESLSMGVPMAAWPMHSDQPRNTVLVVELLRVGVVVREWRRREEEGVVAAAAVEAAVRRLMETKEGAGITKRAAELGEAVRRSREKGGVSEGEFDEFIAHVTR